MAQSFSAMVNGVLRMTSSVALPTIYDQQLTVVSGSAGTNQVVGPITAGTSVTLPSGQAYTGAELQVQLNGQGLEPVSDYAYVGTGTGKTQVQFTFGLVVGDVIDFRIIRSV